MMDEIIWTDAEQYKVWYTEAPMFWSTPSQTVRWSYDPAMSDSLGWSVWTQDAAPVAMQGGGLGGLGSGGGLGGLAGGPGAGSPAQGSTGHLQEIPLDEMQRKHAAGVIFAPGHWFTRDAHGFIWYSHPGGWSMAPYVPSPQTQPTIAPTGITTGAPATPTLADLVRKSFDSLRNGPADPIDDAPPVTPFATLSISSACRLPSIRSADFDLMPASTRLYIRNSPDWSANAIYDRWENAAWRGRS